MAQAYHGTVDEVVDGLKHERLEYGVSLGRRAPMHCMHVDCILEIVNAGLKPVLFIGSVNGPESPLYDPVKNPLTVEQQKEQFRQAIMDSDYDEALVITLEDTLRDDEWMESFVQKLRDNGIYGKAVVHLRTKAVDALKMGEAVPPLSRYNQSFVENGISVWQSYNADPEHDTINASDIRTFDLNRLTIPQRGIIAAPAHLISLARKARAENPDRELLEAHNIPLTVLDLSLDRMWREANISTADVLRLAEETGDFSLSNLAKTATECVKKARGPSQVDADNGHRPQKPLLLLGDSVSPEVAAILRRDGLFEVASGSIGKYGTGEHFTELFYRSAEKHEVLARKIQGAECVIVQSLDEPVGEHKETLYKMIDTARRYGAKKITVVAPFLSDSREDREFPDRFVSVGADLTPRLLKAAGADRVVTFTMHSEASMKTYREVFGDDFIHLSANDIFARHLKGKMSFSVSQMVVGAPDGANKPDDEGQRRAREFSVSLHGVFNEAALFKITKERVTDNETKITNFEGNVAGKDSVVNDDLIDAGGTGVSAAIALKDRGARSVTMCATFGLLTQGKTSALENMMTRVRKSDGSFAIDRLVITDAVPGAAEKIAAFRRQYPELADKIEVVSVGPTILACMKKLLSASPSNSIALDHRKKCR